MPSGKIHIIKIPEHIMLSKGEYFYENI